MQEINFEEVHRNIIQQDELKQYERLHQGSTSTGEMIDLVGTRT